MLQLIWRPLIHLSLPFLKLSHSWWRMQRCLKPQYLWCKQRNKNTTLHSQWAGCLQGNLIKEKTLVKGCTSPRVKNVGIFCCLWSPQSPTVVCVDLRHQERFPSVSSVPGTYNVLGISGRKAKQTSPRVDLGLIVTILTKLKTDTFHGIFFESGTLGNY